MNEDQIALDAWAKAGIHLAEASAQRAEVTPHAMVHLAYYSMFHAARAALLRGTGTSPKKHSGVVSQFGLLVRDRGQAVRSAGEDLKVAEALRIRADYRERVLISAAQAEETLRKAESFLELCAREFGFAPANSADNG